MPQKLQHKTHKQQVQTIWINASKSLIQKPPLTAQIQNPFAQNSFLTALYVPIKNDPPLIQEIILIKKSYNLKD